MAFEQKVDATKKVAAQLVFEALKKHPGVKDRNQFYLQTNFSSSSTELEAVAATKQRWKGREGQVPMVGARAAGTSIKTWRFKPESREAAPALPFGILPMCISYVWCLVELHQEKSWKD